MPILLHAFVAAGYLLVAVMVWRASMAHAAPGSAAGRSLAARLAAMPADATRYRLGTGLRTTIVAAWLVHLWLLRDAALIDGTWRFGFALAMSATMWLVVALFWFESLAIELLSIWLVILPLAAICAVLPLFFPGSIALGRMSGAEGAEVSPWLPAHLAVALAAYGLLTIAAVHALFMAALDRWLHRTGGSAWVGSTEGRSDQRGQIERGMLAPLPPLLTMERVLFKLIGAGFALLTLTVLTGIVFSESLFHRPMKIDYKTVFTMIAWVVFGALLLGRVLRGWRGRIALSWTLGGFAMLFLAYAGSRFVLEVILRRV